MITPLKQFFKQLILACTPTIIRNIYDYQFKQTIGIENGHYELSFSQQAEDLHIQRILGKKSGGFYVDIGAYHPIQYSNTYLFYNQGWSGINIEPNPINFKIFQQYRIRDINLNIAIGAKEETLTYYQFNTPAINSFIKAHADEWASRPGHYLIGTSQIHVYPLAGILEKYLPENIVIDFMNIDVEGLDLQVLASNNWLKFRPRLVLVEAYLDILNPIISHPVVQFLHENKYEIAGITGGTLIFRDLLDKI